MLEDHLGNFCEQPENRLQLAVLLTQKYHVWALKGLGFLAWKATKGCQCASYNTPHSSGVLSICLCIGCTQHHLILHTIITTGSTEMRTQFPQRPTDIGTAAPPRTGPAHLQLLWPCSGSQNSRQARRHPSPPRRVGATLERNVV